MWCFTKDTEDELIEGAEFRMEMTQTDASGKSNNELLYIDTEPFSRQDSLTHTGFRILRCPQVCTINSKEVPALVQ